MMSSKRLLHEHANIVTIALIPALYLAINPSFGQNQAGDWDTWFYFGLAKSFWHHLGSDFPNDYYETRLPYIIPAALIFAIPSDRIASLILSYLVYCICAFSLFYVLSRQVSKPTALLTTIIMAGDIFFMRTVGWQYVDSAVLAYGSLTFAALTAASQSRHRYAFVALSGFLFASMVIVHLGSAPLGLAMVGYAIYIFNIKRKQWREFVALIPYAALGAISCQVLYGLLNNYLYRTTFFFEIEQLAAAKSTYTIPGYFRPFKFLFAEGWWLTLHIAVWFAAGAMIIAKLTKLYTPTRFQTYCMWAVFATYSLLFIGDYLRLSIFMGREGLYASFYLFLSYLFVGSVLPSINRFATVLIIGSLFLAPLVLRFEFDDKLAAGLPAIPSWAVGFALGLLLITAWCVKNRLSLAFVALLAGVLILPITWAFAYEGSIYAARDLIVRSAGNRLPYLAYRETDPIYWRVVRGLIGSFTPHAWWRKCPDFPTCLPPPILDPYVMAVVSSSSDGASVSTSVSAAVPEAKLVNADQFPWSSGKFSVYVFLVEKPPVLIIPGSKLPSLVGSIEGDTRVAKEGTPAGCLTYGPYLALDPGRYEVTIKYEAEGKTGSWDVISSAGPLTAGRIPDTHGMIADIAVTIDLPNGAENLEARALYSGHGRLSVKSVGIRQLNSRLVVD